MRVYYKRPVLFLICLLNELYVLNFYMSFFPKDFFIVRWNSLYSVVVAASMAGAIYKNLVNVIMLWESSMRIVSLDVKQKNEKVVEARKVK